MYCAVGEDEDEPKEEGSESSEKVCTCVTCHASSLLQYLVWVSASVQGLNAVRLFSSYTRKLMLTSTCTYIPKCVCAYDMFICLHIFAYTFKYAHSACLAYHINKQRVFYMHTTCDRSKRAVFTCALERNIMSHTGFSTISYVFAIFIDRREAEAERGFEYYWRQYSHEVIALWKAQCCEVRIKKKDLFAEYVSEVLCTCARLFVCMRALWAQSL